VKASL
jgi:hypothetical protein